MSRALQAAERRPLDGSRQVFVDGRGGPAGTWSDAARRFLAKATLAPGCWIWAGATIGGNRKGDRPYGQFPMPGVTRYAHRASWILFRGDIPDGLRVLHHCDTPLCVNPDHLFLGTQADNVMDMESKGRAPCDTRIGGSQDPTIGRRWGVR